MPQHRKAADFLDAMGVRLNDEALRAAVVQNKNGLQDADLRDADLRRANLQNANLRGANLRGANLQDADLRDADLQYANLRDAGLQDANLRGAGLQHADLRRANLQDADLRRANLQDANLQYADLQDANLRGANLRDADLRCANLQDADLQYANLRGANLQDANLRDADLQHANLQGVVVEVLTAARLLIVPEAGAFQGWKKCRDDVLVHLSIPAEAPRSNATGRKCRAAYADVLEVIGAPEGVSSYDMTTVYRVGERVTSDAWESDRWVECGSGIHFYLTRIEAENHE